MTTVLFALSLVALLAVSPFLLAAAIGIIALLLCSVVIVVCFLFLGMGRVFHAIETCWQGEGEKNDISS